MALAKPNGKPRPIGIGETILQLAGGLLMKKTREKFKRAIGDLEVGIATPGGPEALAHAIAALLKYNDASWCVIKIDVSNAFGNISRVKVVEALAQQVPEAMGYVWARYGGEGTTVFRRGDGNEVRIPARTGVVQGCPMAPALFSLCQQQAYRTVRQQLANDGADLALFSLHDDGQILGPPDVAFRALDLLRAELGKLGLQLNPAKCTAYSPSPRVLQEISELIAERRQSGKDAVDVSEEGVLVAGVPVGSEEFQRAFMHREMSRITKILDDTMVCLNADAPGAPTTCHGLFHVIRLCIPAMFTHLLRALPPAVTRDAAHRLDKHVEGALRRVMNLLESEYSSEACIQRRRLHLPIQRAGFGVPSLEVAASEAHVSSLALVGPTVATLMASCRGGASEANTLTQLFATVRDCLDDIRASGSEVARELVLENFFVTARPRLQSRLASERATREFAVLRRDVALMDGGSGQLGLLVAGCGREAGAFLHPFLRSPRLLLSDAAFQDACRHRLGARIADDMQYVCAACGNLAAPTADHAVGCGGTITADSRASRVLRHSAIKNGAAAELRALSDFGVSVENEPRAASVLTVRRNTDKTADADHIRGDLAVRVRAGSGPAAVDRVFLLDFVVAASGNVTLNAQQRASLREGYLDLDGALRPYVASGAALAEQRKVTHYEGYFTAESVRDSLVPFGIETSGAFGPRASAWLGALRATLRAVPNEEWSHFVRWFRQRISLALQNSNSAAIRGSLCAPRAVASRVARAS